MFVLVVDIKTDDFVPSSTVERETVEVVARVVTAAYGRGGTGLTNMLDGGRTIRFPSDFIPGAFTNLLCYSEKRLSVSVYPSARLKLNTSYTQSPPEVGR
jgi:hypothetical protein